MLDGQIVSAIAVAPLARSIKINVFVNFQEWSKRIGSDIKLRDGMEPVIQPSHNIDCNDCEGVFDVVKDEL